MVFIVDFYSLIKENKTMFCARKWMKAESMLSEICSILKDKYLFSLVCEI